MPAAPCVAVCCTPRLRQHTGNGLFATTVSLHDAPSFRNTEPYSRHYQLSLLSNTLFNAHSSHHGLVIHTLFVSLLSSLVELACWDSVATGKSPALRSFSPTRSDHLVITLTAVRSQARTSRNSCAWQWSQTAGSEHVAFLASCTEADQLE